MPVSPDSRITQAEQDALNALLTTWRDVEAALATAESALDGLLRAAYSPAGDDEAADVFRDGLVRPADEVALPSGRVPDELASRRRAARANRASGARANRRGPRQAFDRRPPQARRHPLAPVTAEDMQAIDDAYDARQSAQAALDTAAQRLNGEINALMYRGGTWRGHAVDCFGDGEAKPIEQIVWPDGLGLYTSQEYRG